MKFDITKILSEWAYRVDDGQPNQLNTDHVNVLREVLYNFGLPYKFINEYVSNIQEIDFRSVGHYKKYKSKHKMRKTTKVNIAGKDTTAGEADSAEKGSSTTPNDTSKYGAKQKGIGAGFDNLTGPTSDAESITGDAEAERKLVDKLKSLTKENNIDLCTISVPGTNLFCAGNKQVPRDEMPQLKSKIIPGGKADQLVKAGELEIDPLNGEVNTEPLFKAMLEKEGISMGEPTPRKVTLLKATQNELDGAKVNMFAKVLAGDKPFDISDEDFQKFQDILREPIIVSKDGYILDGHHRWAAMVQHDLANGGTGDVEMDVKEVDLGAEELVDKTNKFTADMGLATKSGTKDAESVKERKAGVIKAILSHDGDLNTKLRTQKVEIIKELDQDSKEDSKLGKEIREALDVIKTLDGSQQENRKLLIALGQTYTGRDNSGHLKNRFGMGDRDQLLLNEKNLIEGYGDGSPEHVKKTVRAIRKTKVSDEFLKESFDTLPPKLQNYLKSAGKGGKLVGDKHFIGYKKKDGTTTSDRNHPDLEIGEDGKSVAVRKTLPSSDRAMLVYRIYLEQDGKCAYTGMPLELGSMDLEHFVGLKNTDQGPPKDHILDRENDNNFVITTSAANQNKNNMNMGDFYIKKIHPLKGKTKEGFDALDDAAKKVDDMRPKTEQTAYRLMGYIKVKIKGGKSMTMDEWNASPPPKPKIKLSEYGVPEIDDGNFKSTLTMEHLQAEFDSEENEFDETRTALRENLTDETDLKGVDGVQSKIGKRTLNALGLACNKAKESGRGSVDTSTNDDFYKGFALTIAHHSPETQKRLKEIWNEGRKHMNSRDEKGQLLNGTNYKKNMRQEFVKFIRQTMEAEGIEIPTGVLEDKRYKDQWSYK